jgi:hypothetical protein
MRLKSIPAAAGPASSVNVRKHLITAFVELRIPFWSVDDFGELAVSVS